MPSSVLKYEAHRFHDGYLQITIKDKGFLGQGIFLGEAFFPLNELRLGDMDQKLHDLQQIQLPLSKPSGFGKHLFTTGLEGSTDQTRPTRPNSAQIWTLGAQPDPKEERRDVQC